MSPGGNFSAIAMNALSVWPRTADTLIHYEYPGTIDVNLGAGIRLQTRGDSKDVELGAFLGKGEVSADMWMDDALWRWQSETAARPAQVWVKHVLVADLLGRPQSYEFGDEIVLVGIRIPSRRVESLLLQAGFRPSLATWRAKVSDERRRHLPEFIAWLDDDGSDGPRSAPPESGAPKNSGDIKELKERAQHVWMRWYVLFREELTTAGRSYKFRRRPTLDDRNLVLYYHHPSSGARLMLSFDVAAHPLHHTATADFDGQTIVREALAWAEYPEFVAAVGDAIKPRATRKVASPRPTAKPAVKPKATEAAPRTPLPPEKRDEARTQIEELVLPPDRRSAYLARVERAAERGESPRRLVTEATKESRVFMQERAANRGQEATWDEAVVDAFEREPGWRLDVVPRGPGHILTVYPEDGALADAVLSIDVREDNIRDVRWSPGDLTTAQQDELLRRVERALKTARAVKLDEILPSPLQGRIEEIRRRASELGIDPAVLAGRESQGVMATALAYLAERRDMVRDLIQWLQETYYDHPAVEVLAEWRFGSGPATSFTQKVWTAVFQESNTATVTAREDGLRTSCEAPFATQDGKQAVLLRRAGRDGDYRLFQMSCIVQPTGDPNLCEIEDEAGELRDGDQLLVVGDELQAERQIELYRRVASALAEVERTPGRLMDVRQLLFLTAAMIDTPRCKGGHRAAAIRAFEQARGYYDAARRSLARGAVVAASERVHDALRRIGLAAASIAEACAEGQELFAWRVSSEHAPRIEPSAEDIDTMRAVEKAAEQVGPPSPTVSAAHGHQALALAGVATAGGTGLHGESPATSSPNAATSAPVPVMLVAGHDKATAAVSDRQRDAPTLHPGEYESWITRFSWDLQEPHGVEPQRAERLARALAADTLEILGRMHSLTLPETHAAALAAFGWLSKEGLGPDVIEGLAHAAVDVLQGPAEPADCPPGARAFVVHQHDKARSHFDLRLELRGVLKSWTFPREPALTPGERRLAIHVEDHPRAWLNFRGAVPERHGGGKVEVWDTGCWYAEGDVQAAYTSGRFSFRLSGERMQGSYTLARFQGRRTRDSWLLIRERVQADVPRAVSEASAAAIPDSGAPVAHVRKVLAHANVAVDPAGVRVVGRFGECLGDAATRERARRALQDAGILASLVRGRLFFPLRQP
ncbi:MAG: hypothetical protein JNL82_32180 [Myxococcales bacterium]|nr:hypothetical protein [Myxococcales bacterium]